MDQDLRRESAGPNHDPFLDLLAPKLFLFICPLQRELKNRLFKDVKM
jgi:hypothetical protein